MTVHRRTQRRNFTQLIKFSGEAYSLELLFWNQIFIGFNNNHRNDSVLQRQRQEDYVVLTIWSRGDMTILTGWGGVQDTLTDIQGMAKSRKDGYCLTSVNLTFISEEYEPSVGFHLGCGCFKPCSSLCSSHGSNKKHPSLSLEIQVTSLSSLCTISYNPL